VFILKCKKPHTPKSCHCIWRKLGVGGRGAGGATDPVASAAKPAEIMRKKVAAAICAFIINEQIQVAASRPLRTGGSQLGARAKAMRWLWNWRSA